MKELISILKISIAVTVCLWRVELIVAVSQKSSNCSLGFSVDLKYNLTENSSCDLHISVNPIEEIVCTLRNLPEMMNWSASGLQPVIKVKKCTGPVEKYPVMREMSRTFIGILKSLRITNGHLWTISLPQWYCNKNCIQVRVMESHIGTGITIREHRSRFMSNESKVDNCTNDDACIDSSTYGKTTAVLMRNGGESFFILYGKESGTRSILPQCVKRKGRAREAWEKVNSTIMVCTGLYFQFIPRRLILISSWKIYIIGTGLLYSSDRSTTFYQLALSSHIEMVEAFVTSSELLYAIAITAESKIAVFLGVLDSPEFVQLYPSTLFDMLKRVGTLKWPEMTRWSDKMFLSFSDQNELYLIQNSDSFRFPLELLIPYQFFSGSKLLDDCLTDLTTEEHAKNLFSFGLNYLVLCPSRKCPFRSIVIEAPTCATFTHSELFVPDVVRWKDTLPEFNCSYRANELPDEIYLGKFETYTFIIQIEVLEYINGMGSEKVQYSSWVSDPDNLVINMTEKNSTALNIVTYEAILREQGKFTDQFEPGFTFTSVAVDFRIPGGVLQCVDPLTRFDLLPSYHGTVVHLGCPPATTLVFDTNSTQSRFNQHCQPRGNISCYRFNNHFYPVFRYFDGITGETRVLDGGYTLLIMAGGRRLESMDIFNDSTGIESGIWSPLNKSQPPVYPSGEGFRWVCGTRSPCGESIPDEMGKTIHFFFLLQASNRGQKSYCQLSVQFIIQVHGLPMGPVTTLITLLLWHIFILIAIVVLITMWVCCTKYSSCKDCCARSHSWVQDKWTNRNNLDWLVKEVLKNQASVTVVHSA